MLQVEIEKFQYVAVSCTECKLIRLYNPRNRLWTLAYRYRRTLVQNAVAPSHLCHGGPGELIALDKENSSILVFDIQSQHFRLKYFPISLPIDIVEKFVSSSESDDAGQLLVTSCTNASGAINMNAIATETLRNIWSFQKSLPLEKEPQTAAICSDGRGRLFVSSQADCTILVLDGSTGKVIQVLPVRELQGHRIKQMEWSQVRSHLVILHQVCKYTTSLFHQSYYNLVDNYQKGC